MSGPDTLSVGALQLWTRIKSLFPSAVFTSGARTVSQNAGIAGSSSTSQHIGGNAFDFVVPGMDPIKVQQTVASSLGLPFGQSIAEYGAGMGPRNHLSVVGSHTGQLLTANNGVYKVTGKVTNFSGLDLNDPIGSTLRATLPQGLQDWLGGSAADALKAPGDAIDGAIAGAQKALDTNSWFQRGAFMLFALLLIAAALFAFKSSDAISVISKAGKLAA